jgi:hypothetical protein
MNNRFSHDAKFHNLVMWLAKVVNDGLFTMQDLHDALEDAQQLHEAYKSPVSDDLPFVGWEPNADVSNYFRGR